MKNSYITVTDQFCGAGGSSQGVRRISEKNRGGVEVKLAMAFDREYVILGSQKDQVKQCGNAVTPPAMEWLAEREIESLT